LCGDCTGSYRKEEKMARPIRGQGSHLGFQIPLKSNTQETSLGNLMTKCAVVMDKK